MKKTLLFPALLAFSMWTAFADDEGNRAILKLKDPQAALADDKWKPNQSVAVGDFYSVAFLTKHAGGFTAEYFQRVFLFGGTARNGAFLQAFQLQMNTGGRTHVLLYRHLDDKGQLQFVTFHDRFGEQTINIPKRDFHSEREPLPANLKKEFICTFSGEAFPDKFFTPLILSEQDALKLK